MPPAEPPQADEEDGDRIFRIGALVGAGLPSVLSLNGTLKITNHLGAGVNFGMIPKIKLSLYGDAELTYREYDVYARWYPLGGPVFGGVGVGYATIRGTLSNEYDVSPYHDLAPELPDSLEVTSRASVRTMVLTPQLGLLHTFDIGLTLGVDVGAQVPLRPSEIQVTTDLPESVPREVVDAYIAPNDQKVYDTLEKVGRTTIPTINVRIGWML
jgi:hypothetical protein